tara:strand:- start:3813 stop:5477 length:1665 start_codon:yes stop_codon:yes gene_type:complete
MNILDVATQPTSSRKRFDNQRRYNALQSLGDMLIAYGAPTKVGENNLNAFMQISEAANKRNQNIVQQEQQFNQASSLLPLVDQYASSLKLTPERIAQIKADPVGNASFLQALQTNNMNTSFATSKAIKGNLASLQLAKAMGMPMLQDKSDEQLQALSSNVQLQPFLQTFIQEKAKRGFPDLQVMQLNNGTLAVFDKNSIGFKKDGSIDQNMITIIGDKKANTMNVTEPSYDQDKGMWMQKTVILDKNTPDKTNSYGFAVVGQSPSRPLFAEKTSDTQKVQDALETLQIPGIDKNSAEYKAAKMFLDKYANQGKMSLEIGEDGSVKFTQGMPGDGKLSTKMANDINTEIKNIGEDLLKLDNIFRTFDPTFLTLSGRFDRAKLTFKDLMAGAIPFFDELNETEKERLTNQTTFFADVAERFNQILLTMSGAAVMEGEFNRQAEANPNKKDSPTVFAAKVKRQMQFIIGALGRLDKLKARGITGEMYKEELKKNGDSIFGETIKSGDEYVAKRIQDRATEILQENENYERPQAINLAVKEVFQDLGIPLSFLNFYRS